jgi:fatty-acyl-CoA synthase
VATAMTPSVPHLLVILGCLRAQLAVTPVNIRLAQSEGRAYLAPIDPSLVICDDEHEGFAAGLGRELLCLGDSSVPGTLAERLGQLLSADDVRPCELARVDADAVALILPTGGTTGTPKGAFYDHHRTWLWLTSVLAADPHGPDDLDLFCSPFFHVTLGVGLLSRLLGGGTVEIHPRFDAGAVLRAIRNGATRMAGAPTMYEALRRHPEFASTPRDGMRALTFGSAATSAEFVAALVAEYPGAEIRTAYGATEIGPVTAMEHRDLLAGRLTGVGRPLPGVRIRVLGGDGVELPRGEVGELVVASSWQMCGYYGDSEETACTFREDGVHIGDLGYLEDDDWLHIVGRSKDMIITGGENVFPLEVEAVLGRHPAVQDVIVFGAPDDYWGERVHVAVVPTAGQQAALADLRAFGRQDLAGYKLPVALHVLAALPLTPNNKPDRRAVHELALSEPPTETHDRERTPHVVDH